MDLVRLPPPHTDSPNSIKSTLDRPSFTQLSASALAFLHDAASELLILAGEHADLVIYAAATQRLVRRVRDVLPAQPIHGIHAQSAQGFVLVWGASSLAFVSTEDITTQEPRVTRSTLLDWIYDAAISPFHDGVLAAVITAHHEVMTVEYTPTGTISVSDPISPSRPMLFTARLAWLGRESVLVAGGTAFGEIVVWKCDIGADLSPTRHEVLSVLTGHEGSIYGLDIRREPLMLASCSDDRTVRIWELQQRDDREAITQRHDDARETGFLAGPKVPTRPVDEIASNMGHVSRIWGVRFGQASEDGKMGVYSFGEDATMQRWILEVDTERSGGCLSGRLTPGRNFSLHDGKHICASAMTTLDDKLLIATGGADGKISLLEEPMAISNRGPPELGMAAPLNQTVALTMQDILVTLPGESSLAELGGKETISRYDFISEDELLATTSAGRLLRCAMKKGSMVWEEITVDNALREHLRLCYVVRSTGDGTAVLGSSSGAVLFFDGGGATLSTSLPGKIVDICALSTTFEDIEIMVFLLGTSRSQRLVVSRGTGALISETTIAGLDERFVCTAAGVLGNLLFIGSRHGYLSVLRRNDSSFTHEVSLPPRSKDAVSSIIALPPSPSDPQASPYILTTHRDGMYRIYRIDDGDTLQLTLYHETTLPFGPVIAGAWFTTTDHAPELIIYGFRSKNFILWNETHRRELASIDCGGAHRTFALWRDAAQPGRLRFSFTKTSTLMLYRQEMVQQRTVKEGTHGREMRTMAVGGRYLATGSEDTTIRLWEFRGDGLGYLATIKAHTTGLHQVRWHGEEHLVSSAGNEELFVWRVRTLRGGYVRVAILCEGVYKDKSSHGDLRIMDFDVVGEGDEMAITMAFSNSTLKTYRYARGEFTLLREGRYTGACLSQVKHIEETARVMTASTDGHVAIWRAEGTEYVLEQVTPLHGNCIKAMALTPAPDGDGHSLITGGDDNAVGLIQIAPSGTMTVLDIVRSAHAASVNGVVARRQGKDLYALSVSNDQRLRTWRVDSRGLRLVRSVESGVADAGDVCLCDEGVVVGGVGLEIWR